MITATKILSNDGTITGLKIEADEESREELREELIGGYFQAESLLAEGLHGRFEFVQPEEVGALTDSPLLVDCDDTFLSDNGDRQFTAKSVDVFYFGDYMIKCPGTLLSESGLVIFQCSGR